MIPKVSVDIAKFTMASFTSTKWSVKITNASSIMVMEKKITVNTSDIGFSTSQIFKIEHHEDNSLNNFRMFKFLNCVVLC